MAEAPVIRAVTPADASAIAGIYNHYIRHTTVTFEEADVSASDMAGRIATASPVRPWLVAERGGELAGYAYARTYHERAAYRHTVETAVYLDHRRVGQGLGAALYGALLDQLPRGAIHALVGSIALPNEPSVRLHEKLGFEQVGLYPQIGFKFGKWIDVVRYHRLLGTP